MEAIQSNSWWDLWNGQPWWHIIYSRAGALKFLSFIFLPVLWTKCLINIVSCLSLWLHLIFWLDLPCYPYNNEWYMHNFRGYFVMLLYDSDFWSHVKSNCYRSVITLQWVLGMLKMNISRTMWHQNWKPNFLATQLMYILLEGNTCFSYFVISSLGIVYGFAWKVLVTYIVFKSQSHNCWGLLHPPSLSNTHPPFVYL